MSTFKFLAIAAGALLFFSCKKDVSTKPVVITPVPTNPANQDAKVAFSFIAKANNKVLVPDSAWYSNASQDSFTVTKFNYYISNIKFTRDNGTVYAEPNSYRINRHADGPCTFTMSGLPDGIYNKVEFFLGVDSLRNSGGAQTGALDVSQGMYWDWATGYVFFRLEGQFKTQRSPIPNGFGIHIGTNANLQLCTANLGVNTISAAKGKTSTIRYTVNIDEIFANPTNIDFDTYHAVSGGPQAIVISKNYKDMFTVSSVEN